ncbi:MAG: 2-C-methyl-D-erythritol 2,4-cyclodiphosphate synthase [Candidatus Aminicenantes bacterium]|nr:2-C-methyl-D-erythritol 2,4-cyclodiphosphate synthase [Candidatus Aminicenantes bacterium]
MLFLGGIEVPFRKGLLGHSDGDCLIHAVIDALLGAMGQGDIGRVFPDTDPKYEGCRSTELLRETAARLKKQRMTVVNIDAVIIAQQPQLSPFIDNMKNALAAVLKIDAEDLGLKAKTNEGLGEVGRGRAIAAWAAVLLKK